MGQEDTRLRVLSALRLRIPSWEYRKQRKPSSPSIWCPSERSADASGADQARDPAEVMTEGLGSIAALWDRFFESAFTRGEDRADYLMKVVGCSSSSEKTPNSAVGNKRSLPPSFDFPHFEEELSRLLASLLQNPLFFEESGFLVFPTRGHYSEAGIHGTVPPYKSKLSSTNKSAAGAPIATPQPKATNRSSKTAALTKKPLSKQQMKKLGGWEAALARVAGKLGLDENLRLRIYLEQHRDSDRGWEDIDFGQWVRSSADCFPASGFPGVIKTDKGEWIFHFADMGSNGDAFLPGYRLK